MAGLPRFDIDQSLHIIKNPCWIIDMIPEGAVRADKVILRAHRRSS